MDGDDRRPDGPKPGADGDDQPAGDQTPDSSARVRRVLVAVFYNCRERRLRAPWRLLLGLLAFGVALVLGGLSVTLLGNALQVDDLAAQGLVTVAVYLVVVAVGLASLLGCSYLLDRRHVRDLGLGLDRQWGRDLAFGLVLGVVLPTVVFALQYAAGWVRVTGVMATGSSGLLALAGASPLLGLVAVAVFFTGVSLFEEVLVRGYLLTNVAEGLSGVWRFDHRHALGLATIATAVVFGVLHARNPNAGAVSVLNITAFGVVLGLGYVLTDRLGVPIGLHLTWNTVVGAVYGLPVSGLEVGVSVLATEQRGPDRFTGGPFGPEGGVVALLALAVGLGLLWWWVRREYGDVALREGVTRPELRGEE
jgi:membrane protease YdiL (CAAX protease family)